MGRKIITFGVTDKNMIKHLENKEDRSKYIRSLIQKDIERGSVPEDIKEYIQEYIQENIKSLALVEGKADLKNFEADLNAIFDM